MQLQVKVFSGVNAMESNSRLFERIIDVNDSIQVPYDSLVADFKFLYGTQSIVQLNIM